MNDNNNNNNTSAAAERKEEEDYSPSLVEDQMIANMLYEAEALSPGLIEAYRIFTRDNFRDGDKLAVEFKKLIKSYKTYPRLLTHDERMHLLTFVPFVLLKEEKDKKERERQKQKQNQNEKQKPKKETTTVGTCELCHNTKVIGYRKKTLEAFYRKFPEERGITPEYFHICLKCCEKMKKLVSTLKQDNPCLFKEHEVGEISREELLDGLGNQIYRPLKDDNNND